MRGFLTFFGLTISIALLFSSDLAQAYIATFVRLKCVHLSEQHPPEQLTPTKLIDEQELVINQYARISRIHLHNRGGDQVIRCQAFRFPQGLSVSVSSDGKTCLVSGVPMIPQATKNAYVVATNKRGSSLAVVPIAVNAIVFRE